MPANKDYVVSVSVCFTKKYIVNAADWEKAEDIGADEAFGDQYSLWDPDCRIEVTDVETC